MEGQMRTVDDGFNEEMTMKAVLALSLAVLISGCATTSKKNSPEDSYKLTQLQLLESGRLAANRIPVLVVSGANNAIEFRGSRDGPARLVDKERIASISSEYAKFGIPVVIAVDASRVREQKYLIDPTFTEVRTGVSMSARPNPDYQAAQEAVHKAESELRAAQNAEQAMQASGTAHAGVVELADNPGLRWAKENYQTATEILNVTKQSIEETVIETRKEPAASYVINTSGAIFAYVIDVAGESARVVKVPVDHEIKSNYVYHHAGQGGSIFESAALPPPALDLNVEEILRKSDGAPTVSLMQIADDVTGGRKLFADETAALENQRTEMTRNTLLQLDSIAGQAQDPTTVNEINAGAVETR